MTLRGLGVAFLPSTAIADSLADRSLVTVNVIGVASIRRSVVAVQRLGHPMAVPDELLALLGDIPRYIPGATPIRRPGDARQRASVDRSAAPKGSG
jgi:hypothetical protein